MEKMIYLKSNHIYNFRHDIESPLVISFIEYEPEGYIARPCFKVLYESDNKIDYIPFESVVRGDWTFQEKVETKKYKYKAVMYHGLEGYSNLKIFKKINFESEEVDDILLKKEAIKHMGIYPKSHTLKIFKREDE